MIKGENISKKYSEAPVVKNVDIELKEGSIYGLIGPNGAGKTTTIRQLLGFTNATSGKCSIFGMDTRTNNQELQSRIGYLPGETAFFDYMTGEEFLEFMSQMRGGISDTRKHELLRYFELDPSNYIRKMSKGMKQKVALVAAFMHDPAVYILDEPTSGLDPLMQRKFIDLILAEKKRGKTILMSSHMFEEVERTCDRAAIIKEGRIVALDQIDLLKQNLRKSYFVTLQNQEDVRRLLDSSLETKQIDSHKVEIFVGQDINSLVQVLQGFNILGLDTSAQSLEQIFIKYYGEEQDV